MILATLLAFAADAMIVGLDALIADARGYVEVAVSLALFLPGLAVAVRRLHDTDRRGWWLLMPGIPALIVGGAAGATAVGVEGAGKWLAAGGLMFGIVSVLLLVWYCSRGTIGQNRCGPDPLGEGPATPPFQGRGDSPQASGGGCFAAATATARALCGDTCPGYGISGRGAYLGSAKPLVGTHPRSASLSCPSLEREGSTVLVSVTNQILLCAMCCTRKD